jgi:uncharacterized membrane protein YhdT
LGHGDRAHRRLREHRNTAPGNVGFPFWFDIVLPIVLIALLIANHRSARDR